MDTVAPSVTNVRIKTDESLTANAFEFVFTSNEAGKYYYAVMKSSANAPDAETVKASNILGAVTGSGNINPEMSGKEVSIKVNGLDAETSYVVYVVAEDNVIALADGATGSNLSEVIGSEPVSTKNVAEEVPETEIEDTLSPENGTYLPIWLLIALLVMVGVAFIARRYLKRK